MPRINDRKRTAYHEAGHVVVAWHYNIPIWGVSLVKSRHTNGESRIFGHFRRFQNLQYGRISLGDGGTFVKGFQQPKNL
jgi:hypothetical protein